MLNFRVQERLKLSHRAKFKGIIFVSITVRLCYICHAVCRPDCVEFSNSHYGKIRKKISACEMDHSKFRRSAACTNCVTRLRIDNHTRISENLFIIDALFTMFM